MVAGVRMLMEQVRRSNCWVVLAAAHCRGMASSAADLFVLAGRLGSVCIERNLSRHHDSRQ